MYHLDKKYYTLIELPEVLYGHIGGIYTQEDQQIIASAEEDGYINEGVPEDKLITAHQRGVVDKVIVNGVVKYKVAKFYSRMECVAENEVGLLRSMPREDFLPLQKHMMDPTIWLVPRIEKVANDDAFEAEGVLPVEVAEDYYRKSNGIFYAAQCNCNSYMDLCQNRDKSKVCIHAFNGELPINSIYGRGIVQRISKEKAIELLHYADSIGLIHSVHVSEKGLSTCNCCTCCCFSFSNFPQYDIKGKYIKTDYIIELVDADCLGCGACTNICQFQALWMDDNSLRVDSDKCWGCGVCRSACPTGALRINKR